jgi:phage tail protein X
MAYVQYTAQEGDRWDLVAYEAYGDVTKMDAIIKANPSVSITPEIPAGTKLQIPIIEEEEAVAETQLPPWKR